MSERLRITVTWDEDRQDCEVTVWVPPRVPLLPERRARAMALEILAVAAAALLTGNRGESTASVRIGRRVAKPGQRRRRKAAGGKR